ncbi:4-(cytidine 5'-diphospho)-2-C-methyl-D-erythritol kinase [Rhabdothermincola sp.]|uniref:4-(cytidine 5'-diphospho)-2-C-methyl-D-erythritol kinase n=1 Tax=Rhabdothermincola sp. TaxID=2820405 RepID=UPI002FE06435
MASEIVIAAPAKLTLSLRITGVRTDGYHLIDAEMVSLDLCDTLTLTDGDGLEVVAPDGVVVPADDGNLVRRAQRLAGLRAHVRLDKRIPPGAGLGGGSSDAAAVLRAAGFDDLQAAARIGADVPFCLIGGRARVRGIGELVEPLPFVDRCFTLLIPPFGCSTVEVYRAWDRLGGPVGEHGNDLEPAALLVEPRLAEWRDRLAASTGQQPRLAGSGSTWFVEGDHPVEGGLVVRTLAAQRVPG